MIFNDVNEKSNRNFGTKRNEVGLSDPMDKKYFEYAVVALKRIRLFERVFLKLLKE